MLSVCVCPLKWGEKDKKQTPVSRPVWAGLVFYCSFTTLSVCFLTVWCSRVHWLSHVVLLALAVFIPFSTVCSWILSSVSCNYLCLKVIHFSRSSDLNVSGRPRGRVFFFFQTGSKRELGLKDKQVFGHKSIKSFSLMEFHKYWTRVVPRCILFPDHSQDNSCSSDSPLVLLIFIFL